MSQIKLYFLHSASVVSFCIDVVMTFSIDILFILIVITFSRFTSDATLLFGKWIEAQRSRVTSTENCVTNVHNLKLSPLQSDTTYLQHSISKISSGASFLPGGTVLVLRVLRSFFQT